MMYLYIILAVLLILLVLLVTVPVRVIADYADGSCRLLIRILGISIDTSGFGGSKKNKKPRKPKKQPEESVDEDEKLLDRIHSAYKLVQRIKKVYDGSRHYVSRHFFADDLYVNISFGTWDAALTGMATGAVWALLYEILGLLTTVATVNHHKFTVDTVYDRSFFDVKAGAVLKFRIAGVAGILLCVLYNLRKYKE